MGRTMDRAGLLSLVGLTLRDTDAAGRALVALRLPRQARWLGLALVAVLTVLMMRLTFMLVPAAGPVAAMLLAQGVAGAVLVQAGSLVLIALATTLVGRMFGGRGRFDDALLLATWQGFIMVLMGIAQLVLLFVVPPLTLPFAIITLGLFLWMLIRFAMVLHGFTNPLAVLGGIIGTVFCLGLIMAFLAALFGVAPPPGGN